MTSKLRDAEKQQIIIRGQKPGYVTTIVGCTHGDEKIGAEILDWLLETLNPEDICGEIRLVLANPEAYDADRRFMDEDLNRLMAPERLAEIAAKPEHERNTEEKRALELAELYKDVDHLLDIHATGKPSEFSFTCSADTPIHNAIAENFDVDYIISEHESAQTSMAVGPTDTYIDLLGGVGVTLEAGWLGDSTLLDATKEDVARFLKHVGAVPNMPVTEKRKKPAQKFVIYEEMRAATDEYIPAADFSNFHEFKQGELIATDGGTEIRASKDSVIIFPKKDLQKGNVTGYLAEKIKEDACPTQKRSSGTRQGQRRTLRSLTI